MSKKLCTVRDWPALAAASDFDSATMAARLRVDLRTLERFFRNEFNKTPRQWCMELRCVLAANRILEGYATKAAAAEYGFSDPPHFCREFKKHYGVPPQHYIFVSSPSPSPRKCR